MLSGPIGRAVRFVALVAALLLLLSLRARPALALEPIALSATHDAADIALRTEVLRDGSRALSIDGAREAAASDRFEPATGPHGFGYTDAAYWFHFVLRAGSAGGARSILEIAYAPLDDVRVFVERPDGTFDTHLGGDRLPFAAREIPDEGFVFAIDTPPARDQHVFVRVVTQSSMQVPIALWRPAVFAERSAHAHLALGIYFGAMLVMVAYNLFVFFSVRDRSYLYYVLYVGAFVLFQACVRGVAYRYLWPDAPAWNDQSILVFNAVLTLLVPLFARAFLGLQVVLPRWHRVLTWSMAVSAVPLSAAALLPYRFAVRTVFADVVLMCILAMLAGAAAWRAGVRAARFYLLAWVPLHLVTLAYGLAKVGVLPQSPIIENGFAAASAFEVVLLSLALADRINLMKIEKAEAQARALVIQKDANENLQREVERQTQELTAQAARLREADRQKTHFFQNVSHELRTPLTLILNPLEELVREGTSDARVSVAIKNTRRLLRLVNQLLDFQRLSSGKKEWRTMPIDVGAFLRSCAAYVAPACAAQSITLRAPEAGAEGDAPLVVLAEVDALEKIVFNYLANAMKYTRAGGAIGLSAVAEGDRVRIVVEDEGPGISEDDAKKLFSPFSQLEDGGRGGTGLGLALVKELTVAMGGEVGVAQRAAPDRGSAFFASLPRATGAPGEVVEAVDVSATEGIAASIEIEATAVAEPPAVSEGEGAPYVLVVDDLSDMRELLRRALTRAGHRVRAVASGRDALAAAREQRPDLVLTDWMMPGMSGPDLVAALRADDALRGVPIVLLTAKSDEESKRSGTEIGADAFLGKPFDEQELLGTVRNLLALKAREREVERLHRHLAEDVLKRYLPPELVDRIVSGEIALEAEPETALVTVLFADLAGFTRASSQLRATKSARVLNEYLSRMNDVVFAHGGTIDKYLGDGMMVLFGAPLRLEAKDQVQRAAACALAMQVAMRDLGERWAQDGVPALELRIGLHHGPAVVGNFGDARRSDYTAIGPTVNLASRIEGVCAPGQVLVSGEVYDYLPEAAGVDAGAFEMKGIDGAVRCFRLVGSEGDAGAEGGDPSRAVRPEALH